MKGKLLKGGLTVLGAILLSTVGIFASDRLQGLDRSLTGLAGQGVGVCTNGMVPLKHGDDMLCVDVYEASPSEDCPHLDPANILETEKNTTAVNCFAVSVSGVLPWSFISLPQAQRMCANSGKRLPTTEEWYRFALGTKPDECAVQGNGRVKTGTDTCLSTTGVHDAVGNVWEWVDENVVGNTYRERALPEEGYVTSVDSSGVAITTGESPDDLYGKDYVWSEKEGVFGMLRGGFYGSESDAGLYAVNASVPTSFGSQGVGFRCVEDIIR